MLFPSALAALQQKGRSLSVTGEEFFRPHVQPAQDSAVTGTVRNHHLSEAEELSEETETSGGLCTRERNFNVQ